MVVEMAVGHPELQKGCRLALAIAQTLEMVTTASIRDEEDATESYQRGLARSIQGFGQEH